MASFGTGRYASRKPRRSSKTRQRRSSTSLGASIPSKPRVPGYSLASKLGEGNFASVWLAAEHGEGKSGEGEKFAIKHFDRRKSSSIQSGLNEIRILRMWFGRKGELRESVDVHEEDSKYDDRDDHAANGGDCHAESPESLSKVIYLADFPGTYFIAALKDVVRHPEGDLSLVYARGGRTLAEAMWTIKGQFHRGERVYHVLQSDLWHSLFDDDARLFKSLLRSLLHAVALLRESQVAHADIKPDNILVDYDSVGKEFRSILLVDFGSAFRFYEAGSQGRMQSATPEYLAPELSHNSGTDLQPRLAPGIDAWALGTVFFEIAGGFPLWFPYKSRVTRAGRKDFWTKGLLAVPGRDGVAIRKKQMRVFEDVTSSLRRCPGKGMSRDELAMHLIGGLLSPDWRDRMSAAEALCHPYLETGETA